MGNRSLAVLKKFFRRLNNCDDQSLRFLRVTAPAAAAAIANIMVNPGVSSLSPPPLSPILNPDFQLSSSIGHSTVELFPR